MQRMSLIKSKITENIQKQMQFGGEDGNYRSPTSSPQKERPSPVGDDNSAVLQREIEALKREKSQLNA